MCLEDAGHAVSRSPALPAPARPPPGAAPAAEPRGYCEVDGCERPVEAANLCAAHRYRKKRGLALSPAVKEREPPFERCITAWEAWIEAESDEEYHRAKARLRAASWDWLDPAGELRRLARAVRNGDELQARRIVRQRSRRRKALPRWDER